MNGKLFGKRKFIIAGTALLMTFFLANVHVVDGSQWFHTIGAIIGLYGVANVGEHFSKRNGE